MKKAQEIDIIEDETEEQCKERLYNSLIGCDVVSKSGARSVLEAIWNTSRQFTLNQNLKKEIEMPNAAVKLTGEDLLLKQFEDLQEQRYILGSIQGCKLAGVYTDKDALTEKALRESCFKLETRIRNMIKNLYNDRFILEGLQK